MVKIVDVVLKLFERELPVANYGPSNPLTGGKNVLGLLSIHTDEGLVGHSMLGAPYRTARIDAESLIIALKPLLIGRDPLDREAIYSSMLQASRHTTWRCIGAVDVALWDLGGKIAGLPVYKLIGAYRHEMPAYASSVGFKDAESYIADAQAVRDAGYRAYKIHPPREGWRKDVQVCADVRAAMGDEYTLMLDSSWVYNYTDALRVGREIEELGFYWFEDPLEKDDVYNSRKLREQLRIPIMATQDSPGAFHAYTPWLTERATDYLRGDVAVKGGITGCLKIAHLAEAFRLNFEMHQGGNSINNFANLHVMCAIPNSELFEVLLPDEIMKYGVLNDLSVSRDGIVKAPTAPGIGAEIDFELIDRTTIAELR